LVHVSLIGDERQDLAKIVQNSYLDFSARKLGLAAINKEMTNVVSSCQPPEEAFIATRASLLARLKDWDDSRGWNEFYEIYWRLIYGRARKAGLTEQEAQEVLQEVLISVAKRMGEFRYDPAVAKFKTWLYLIVSRRISDQHRRRCRHSKLVQPLLDEDGISRLEEIATPESLEPDASWEAEWEKSLLAGAVEKLKGRVKPEHFQIYDYNVIQGHDAEETARHLEVSRAKVYWIKTRVGAKLQQEVDRLRKNPI
jgi:RNA polymerase sigma factor (sigma-70 family)